VGPLAKLERMAHWLPAGRADWRFMNWARLKNNKKGRAAHKLIILDGLFVLLLS
jgi:hypothetical protein